MKTLKLDHQVARLIQNGVRTTTWRLYDDKDLRVDDRIELIDKVDPHDPDTWRIFGTAKIDVIVEKRLGSITKTDTKGHKNFASKDDMLHHYRGYYGDQVSFDTPVKIIHFTLENGGDALQHKPLGLKEAKLYADGGSRGNPGPSASGYVIFDKNDNIVVKNGVYLGVTTNNQAEYQALKLGIEEAHNLGVQRLHVHMDSLLVINQMLGIFKVKNRDLWPIYQSLKELSQRFIEITFAHIPRELNKLADAEVNIVLDRRAKR